MAAAAAAAAHLLPMHPSASAVHNEARNVVAVAAAAAVAVASAGMARSGGVGVDIGCDRCWSVSSSVLPSLKRFDWHWQQLVSATGAAVLLLLSTAVVWPMALQNKLQLAAVPDEADDGERHRTVPSPGEWE